MNTTFTLHPRRLYTWTSPMDGSKHQIDYIMIEQQHSEIITAARTFPGADCGSDHELLIAELKLKIKKKKKEPIPLKLNVDDIAPEYTIAVKNRFSTLIQIAEEMDPENLASNIRDILKDEGKNI